MSELSRNMRTAKLSAWMVAFGLLVGATPTQVAQSAPDATPSPTLGAATEPLPATIEFNRNIRPGA